MRSLWLYDRLSRLARMSYRAKIMWVAFLGTHVPLVALSVYQAARWAADGAAVLATLGVTLAATLVGTLFTLFSLDRLLAPVRLTGDALRAYRRSRQLPALPDHYRDAAGRLMADAQATMTDLEQSLVRLERFDPETGALNRAGFLHMLAGSGGPQIVAVLHVANFGRVAASIEQAAASVVLRTIIQRLTERLGPSAQVARIGDADIAFLLPDSARGSSEADMAFGLRTLIMLAAGPVAGEGLTLTPVLRAGLAALSPGMDAETALGDALAAASVASDAEPVTIHSPALRERVRTRFLLEEELRAAIAGEGFALHFQPVVDSRGNRPVGAEALLRWNNPVRGPVPPSVFVPVAEASGLIESIGLWVLREACRQAAGWQGDMRVAINLGARQFLDEDLAWHVDEAARAAGLSHDRIEIELTESVAMVDHDHTRRTFGQLRDMGVQIAIDDFGTGYASMSTLRKLPFTKLKIDREFVTDVHLTPQSQAICAAVIALGRGLGLEVLAEGTERREEVDWLAARGCDLFQGYYFSRPVPAAELHPTFARLGLEQPGATAAAG